VSLHPLHKPYFGLRDYGLPTSIWGGDKNCNHEWVRETNICPKCGAWKGCLGLEPTPEEYVENMVGVFKGVWKVLRDDGVVWLNLGNSYAGSGKAGSNPEYQKQHTQFGQKERKERLGKPTSAEVARKQGRDSIGIELSKEYCKLIEKRMRKFKLSLF